MKQEMAEEREKRKKEEEELLNSGDGRRKSEADGVSIGRGWKTDRPPAKTGFGSLEALYWE